MKTLFFCLRASLLRFLVRGSGAVAAAATRSLFSFCGAPCCFSFVWARHPLLATRAPAFFFCFGAALCVFAHRPERGPPGMVRRRCFSLCWASPSAVVAVRLFLRGDRRRAGWGLSGATMRSLCFCVGGAGPLCFLFSQARASAISSTLTTLSVVFPALSVTSLPVRAVLFWWTPLSRKGEECCGELASSSFLDEVSSKSVPRALPGSTRCSLSSPIDF